MGDGNTIGPYAVIARNVTLGDDNWIGAHAVLGVPPELRSHEHSSDWFESNANAGVSVGDKNVFREGVQIHSGAHSATTVADRCFIMNQVYLAHDSRLGSDVTLASGVRLAGHVVVDDGANLGLSCVVHQFRRVGAFAMIGMAAVVTRDLPAFVVAYGNPALVIRANTVGLERAGFDKEEIDWITLRLEGSAHVGQPPSSRLLRYLEGP